MLNKGYVSITVWMHYLDFSGSHEEKARWKIHKNVTSCFEQILEATHQNQQLYGLLPNILQTIQVRWTRHARQTHTRHSSHSSFTWTCLCWLSSKNLHNHLCVNTGYSLVDLSGMVDNRDRWLGGVRELVYILIHFMLISAYVWMMLFLIENWYYYGLKKFFSRTASFQCNMKWAEKVLCLAITNSLILKSVLTSNSQYALE